MTSFGVTLLSGGLDSTTVTTYARDRVDRLMALTFHYGQTHSKEVECARQIAALMGVQHKLLDISFLGEVAWYSALTNPEQFPIPSDRSSDVAISPKDRATLQNHISTPGGGEMLQNHISTPAGGEMLQNQEIGFGIPITYVPLRNTIFLSLSAAYLESQVLYAIEVEGLRPEEAEAYIYLAPNAIDYSGYPDCRPEYYEKVAQALEYGSKLWTQYGVRLQVETPIIELSKAEIAELGVRLKAPLEYTWSCYQGGEVPCGGCDSCVLRARGFQEAGISDPLLVRLGKA